MKRIAFLFAAAALASCGPKNSTAMTENKYETESFTTKSGKNVEITLIKHGSLAVSFDGRTIQIDPVADLGEHTDYAADFGKADFILVTHEHYDHLCDSTVRVLTGENTKIFINAAGKEQLGYGEAIGNGETYRLTENISLEAVPAYNTTDGREKFHPAGNGNGYVLDIDGLRIYIAGDTEDIPEMAGLKDIDVAFLPVNQPYTMTVPQCVAAARMIAPKVLIPYHSSETDLSQLPELLPEIDVRIRNMQ